ncbi:MAG: peptide chain release factor 2 [Frankiaceae bacterium]|jgi:peptide chain release factor 2|nr:peptide chain release factor 2 [Frankiaceae bacterium]
MAAVEPAEELKRLDATMRSVEEFVDLAAKRGELEKLREQASVPDLWNDPDAAREVTSRLSAVESEIGRVEGLRQRLDDLVVLLELAGSEDDADARAEVERELLTLDKAVGELEVRTLMSGEYDAREALVVVSAGAGGVDASDWARMLLEMYQRWASRHGYPVDVYDLGWAEEAGIKSATFAVKAPYAYGTLRGEHGVHRLVRISPFDNQSRRQTSFAGVEVTPVVEATDEVEIDEKDLRVDIFRSSGPGGQGVNTTDSAIRLTHLPTGIVVTCQNERSQLQNKASAMAVLQAKLLERRRQEDEAKMNEIRGGRQDVNFGSAFRHYVLHPYQLVKDDRTHVETGNIQAVLDGEIDQFIEAGVRWRNAPAEV